MQITPKSNHLSLYSIVNIFSSSFVRVKGQTLHTPGCPKEYFGRIFSRFEQRSPLYELWNDMRHHGAEAFEEENNGKELGLSALQLLWDFPARESDFPNCAACIRFRVELGRNQLNIHGLVEYIVLNPFLHHRTVYAHVRVSPILRVCSGKRLRSNTEGLHRQRLS
jgi:hypothetical protein